MFGLSVNETLLSVLMAKLFTLLFAGISRIAPNPAAPIGLFIAYQSVFRKIREFAG